MNITGLLPAAGLGTRLGLPFPKELIDHKGEALILRAAKLLTSAGVHRIVIVTRPGKEQIADYLVHYQAELAPIFFVEQLPPFGNLLHALQAAAPILSKDHVHFAMPDTVFLPNPFLPIHEALSKPKVHCFLASNETWKNFGVVDQGTIQIIDKPHSYISQVCWGAITWPPEFTATLLGCNDLTSALNAFGFEYLINISEYHDFGTIKAEYQQATVA